MSLASDAEAAAAVVFVSQRFFQEGCVRGAQAVFLLLVGWPSPTLTRSLALALGEKPEPELRPRDRTPNRV